MASLRHRSSSALASPAAPMLNGDSYQALQMAVNVKQRRAQRRYFSLFSASVILNSNGGFSMSFPPTASNSDRCSTASPPPSFSGSLSSQQITARSLGINFFFSSISVFSIRWWQLCINHHRAGRRTAIGHFLPHLCSLSLFAAEGGGKLGHCAGGLWQQLVLSSPSFPAVFSNEQARLPPLPSRAQLRTAVLCCFFLVSLSSAMINPSAPPTDGCAQIQRAATAWQQSQSSGEPNAADGRLLSPPHHHFLRRSRGLHSGGDDSLSASSSPATPKANNGN